MADPIGVQQRLERYPGAGGGPSLLDRLGGGRLRRLAITPECPEPCANVAEARGALSLPEFRSRLDVEVRDLLAGPYQVGLDELVDLVLEPLGELPEERICARRGRFSGYRSASSLTR
jgi:hypothetical protein